MTRRSWLVIYTLLSSIFNINNSWREKLIWTKKSNTNNKQQTDLIRRPFPDVLLHDAHRYRLIRKKKKHTHTRNKDTTTKKAFEYMNILSELSIHPKISKYRTSIWYTTRNRNIRSVCILTCNRNVLYISDQSGISYRTSIHYIERVAYLLFFFLFFYFRV